MTRTRAVSGVVRMCADVAGAAVTGVLGTLAAEIAAMSAPAEVEARVVAHA